MVTPSVILELETIVRELRPRATLYGVNNASLGSRCTRTQTPPTSAFPYVLVTLVRLLARNIQNVALPSAVWSSWQSGVASLRPRHNLLQIVSSWRNTARQRPCGRDFSSLDPQGLRCLLSFAVVRQLVRIVLVAKVCSRQCA